MKKVPTLRESLREDYEVPVEEAALRAGDALRQNLSLYVDHSEKKAVLYRLDRTQTNLWEALRAVGYIGLGEISPSRVFGSSLGDFRAVKLSASEPGLGPLMYDIGLGMSYPRWVMADRGSVSRSAKGVWEHYLLKRPDVERLYLPDHFRGPLNKELETLRERVGGTRDFLVWANDLFQLRQEFLPYRAPDKPYVSLMADYGTAWEQAWAQEEEELETSNTLGEERRNELEDEIVEEIRRQEESVLRKEPLLWAFRLKAPESAKQGPALSKLLMNHKENLEWWYRQPLGKQLGTKVRAKEDLENMALNKGGDLFDEKYLGG